MTNPTRYEICAGGCEEQTGTKCGNCGVAVEIELTDAEVAQIEADRIAWEAQKAEEEAAKVALEALKASARAKLVSGQPMTEEEAATIII